MKIYLKSVSETSGAAMRRKKREAKARGLEGSKLLATDGEWELWEPLDWYGSIYLASLYSKESAQWDTADISTPRYFELVSKGGPLYIFVNKHTGEKYQSQPSTQLWLYDMYDRSLGKQTLIDFLDEHPAFADYFNL